MNCKSLELEQTLEKRNIDILCVQETKWKNLAKKSRFLNMKSKQYKLLYYGTTQARNGVGIILKKHLYQNLVEVNYVNDRIIIAKIVFEKRIINVISAYAPQVGTSQEEKDQFWSEMENAMTKIPENEMKIFGADFNSHVGKFNTSYEACHGGYGYGVRNREGEVLLDFCSQRKLTIMNTCYKKKEKHLITYKSGESRTQIDFILCDSNMRNTFRDCKVILNEQLVPQHKLLVGEFVIQTTQHQQPKIKIKEKIRWNRLSEDNEFVEIMHEWMTDIMAASDELSVNEIWNSFEEICKIKAREQLGVTKGNLNIGKEAWWWNDNVAKAVGSKKEAFKKMMTYNGSDETVYQQLSQEYKQAKKNSKVEVAKAMTEASKRLYEDLETPEGSQRIYKIASQRKHLAKAITNPKYIEDSQNSLLTEDEAICQR